MPLKEAIEATPGAAHPAVVSQAVPHSLRWAAMLDHPTLAVAVIRQGRIVEANAPWRALFAWPADVSSESHVATLFANVASADRFERALQAELSADVGGALTARAEHMLVRRDGGAFLAELVVSLLNAEDADRPLTGDAVWQVRDITVERALRRELRDLEDYHRELSRHQWDMTFVIDRKGRVSYASASIESALGYRVHAMLGQPFASLLEPGHARAAERWLRAASHARGGGGGGGAGDVSTGDGFLLHVMDGDGKVRVLACRPRDCFDVPRIAGMVIHARDVTGAQTEVLAPAPRESRRGGLHALMRSMDDPSRIGDPLEVLLEGIRQQLDAASASLWLVDGDAGESLRAAVFREEGTSRCPPPLSIDGAPDAVVRIDDLADSDVPAHALISLVAAGIGAIVEAPVRDRAATIGWIVVGASELRRWLDADVDLLVGGTLLAAQALRGDGPRTVATAIDAPAFVADVLTGLPGRIDAERRIAAMVADKAGAGSVTVFFVDLDHLQQVNESGGFARGDAVIARAARVLEATAGEAAFVARVSGDEFVVAVRQLATSDADAMAQAMLDGLDAFTDGISDASSIGASIGIAAFPGDAADAATLLLQADLAMREAKSRGRGQAAVFNARFVAALELRKSLDAEIEDALQDNQFMMFYQPQVALASGQVVGLEALLRWQHPTRGILLPEAFIGTALKRGLIDAVTKTALVQVCEQIAAWRRQGDTPELPVSVNVSGRQFHDSRLPALVASALLRCGLPARLLMLEITEQNLVGDDAAVQRVVKELSRLGVRIAIGDFNVGHASFRSLRRLGVSQIKLNAAFVKGLLDDPEGAIVVAAVVELARRLKYQVIAEGVETREQRQLLQAAGCEVGQGFYFGAPLSTAEISSYLEMHKPDSQH